MRNAAVVAVVVAVVAVVAGCGGGKDPAPGSPDSPPPIADAPGPRPDSSVDKSAGCVSSFGNALTTGFGRLDGTLVAVVPPGSTCPRPNSTHLILEVRQNNQVYRMVAAVISDVGDPVMALAERDAALSGPAWQEGWHLGVPLDYVATLGVHRLDFAPAPKQDLVDAIDRAAVIGGRVSVYATVEDQHDSAHLIHRNQSNKDGAIVFGADGPSPHYFLLRFDNQLF
ncbi:MAG: hypothetical protein KIT31_33035 [Deltaproteobacteria bacterium]|nr:hypothetical protein [Deltaproteobacteria bacterium]